MRYLFFAVLVAVVVCHAPVAGLRLSDGAEAASNVTHEQSLGSKSGQVNTPVLDALLDTLEKEQKKEDEEAAARGLEALVRAAKHSDGDEDRTRTSHHLPARSMLEEESQSEESSDRDRDWDDHFDHREHAWRNSWEDTNMALAREMQRAYTANNQLGSLAWQTVPGYGLPALASGGGGGGGPWWSPPQLPQVPYAAAPPPTLPQPHGLLESSTSINQARSTAAPTVAAPPPPARAAPSEAGSSGAQDAAANPATPAPAAGVQSLLQASVSDRQASSAVTATEAAANVASNSSAQQAASLVANSALPALPTQASSRSDAGVAASATTPAPATAGKVAEPAVPAPSSSTNAGGVQVVSGSATVAAAPSALLVADQATQAADLARALTSGVVAAPDGSTLIKETSPTSASSAAAAATPPSTVQTAPSLSQLQAAAGAAAPVGLSMALPQADGSKSAAGLLPPSSSTSSSLVAMAAAASQAAAPQPVAAEAGSLLLVNPARAGPLLTRLGKAGFALQGVKMMTLTAPLVAMLTPLQAAQSAEAAASQQLAAGSPMVAVVAQGPNAVVAARAASSVVYMGGVHDIAAFATSTDEQTRKLLPLFFSEAELVPQSALERCREKSPDWL
eukprot:TRINITY_DN41301_c0_g1_i1.p1 TRINITY_DN41301_c0_g1~~TRINITY_DN41301_c0_g1_i1.p1  ORF type:complete len:622 (-),score=147.99 TRINITY_DN41301_c0_g1_i1:36-1901(-)